MMSTSPHSRPHHQLLYFFKNSERYRFFFLLTLTIVRFRHMRLLLENIDTAV